MLLLVGVVTLVSFLRSFVSPERVRRTLAGRNVVAGATGAALFGVVTPFCSCSAVPLFIGFVEAGVPLGVTFAFLVSAPMVNEVALVLLWGLFGPTIAVAYLVAGLIVAIGAGLVVSRLHLERFVEPYVYEIHAGAAIEIHPTMEQRVRDAWDVDPPDRPARRALGRHRHRARVAHPRLHADRPRRAGRWALQPAGGAPRRHARRAALRQRRRAPSRSSRRSWARASRIGTVLAFMMAVTALSIPELLILRRVMRRELIAVFVIVVASGIVVVGYLFNLVSHLKGERHGHHRGPRSRM